MIEGPRELTTERLLLRRFSEADRAPFAALNADPIVMEFMKGVQTRAESDRTIDRIEAAFAQDGLAPWAIELRETAEFIGMAGLARATFASPATPAVEILWRLARPHWGHGYATEAARQTIDDGFGRLALEEIVSFTAEANRRSARVMQRLGMTRDPSADFDHPALEEGHPLRRHITYRLRRPGLEASTHTARTPL